MFYGTLVTAVHSSLRYIDTWARHGTSCSHYVFMSWVSCWEVRGKAVVLHSGGFCSDLLFLFVCFNRVSKFLWVGCSGFRSPVCKVHGINEWNSWGPSAPSQSGYDNAICDGLGEVGNGIQVILSLSLTHCRPHRDRLFMPHWDVFFKSHHSSRSHASGPCLFV